MSFNPAGTKWSVAAFDNEGRLGNFRPTPWELHNQSMQAGTHWTGGYTAIPDRGNAIACETIGAGAAGVTDTFEVVFVTPDRFIATQRGAFYRFGKKL